MREQTARRSARYVYLSDAEPRSSARDLNDPNGRGTASIGWRIVAANNRPLGRSAARFSSLTECVAAVHLLRTEVARAIGAVSLDPARGHWLWTLTLDQQMVAASVHDYERRIECVRALAQFIQACGTADPAPVGVRQLGVRAMYGYPPKPSRAFEPAPLGAE